jgi:hypothetical protein
MTQETREIFRHAIIGGAVEFVLVEFERLRDWMDLAKDLANKTWFGEWLNFFFNLPHFLQDFTLGVIAFLVAFFLLAAALRLRQRA